MVRPNYKGGDILVDKEGNAFLVLKFGLDVVSFKNDIIIPYAEVEILFKSPLSPNISLTRLLGGDFTRLTKMTYPEAQKRHGVMVTLYGTKA